jgi:23S rRNA (guanine2445-N2)-methyltransferase / 23S rRNA (guanine2069-N7)-methyltransferase
VTSRPGSSAAPLDLFATCTRNLEPLLLEEVIALGGRDAKAARGGVTFTGSLEAAYRICLWSRLASRVLLTLTRFAAGSPDELYEGARSVAWEEHLGRGPNDTFAVYGTGSGTTPLGPSHFLALRVKDALVDRLRERTGSRPSVDTRSPGTRFTFHVEKGQVFLALDLSGEALHRRGYREPGRQAEAPLKENLAAAVLVRAGWPALVEAGVPFVDPLCGSGTLPLEAALLGADIAPGLLREEYGFLAWRGHDDRLWAGLLSEARDRRGAGLRRLPPIAGYDRDAGALRLAARAAERAGLRGRIHLERRDIAELAPLPGPPGGRQLAMPAVGEAAGLLATNAPYGRRLGEHSSLVPLYRLLGERLRERFSGWRAALLTADPSLARETRLRADRYYSLYNGPIEVRLYLFRIGEAEFRRKAVGEGAAAGRRAAAPRAGPPTLRPAERPPQAGPAPSAGDRAGGEMFANRLRKNRRHLRRWARREGVTCYRLYDADIPEYAVAVDLYERWVHVQEYEPPPEIDPDAAERRLGEVLRLVPQALELPPENVFLKVRRRQRGPQQYEKLGETGVYHEVGEGGLRFLVNFTDYLDTGLFLDHRSTRSLIRETAQGRRFLNLFAYTSTATVYAAAGGAASTTSVDLSRAYLTWAERNLELNGIRGPDHVLVRADVLRWISEAVERGLLYDLVFLDPPTFSTSAAMEGTFDVQRDHVWLLNETRRLLSPGGLLLFSSNYRKFRLDRAALYGFEIDDITARTVPPDFARRSRPHQAWLLTNVR